MSRKIIITGGGTGGHVFPALAIAEEMKKRGFEPVYVGSPTGMEAKLVPERKIRFVEMRSGSIKNQGKIKILFSLLRVCASILKSMLFLLRERPVAVVGVGGYVSVPVSIASFLMRKPLFLQEQNASVGIANRFLGKLASRIFLGFEQARDCFPSGKCLFTGNPLRSDFLETDAGNYRSDSDLLLVMGGSQGARAINDMIVTLLPKIQKAYPNLKIIHQTGASEFEKVKSQYHQAGATHHEVVPFIKQVSEVYKKASVVVCRSGALTVSELIHVGRPAIFIPYPRLGQNDQTANAHLVEAAGAGRVVLQGENLADRFWTTFEEVYRPSTLREMHGRYSKLRTNGALATIGDQIEKAL